MIDTHSSSLNPGQPAKLVRGQLQPYYTYITIDLETDGSFV